jgi:hypothetical protein
MFVVRFYSSNTDSILLSNSIFVGGESCQQMANKNGVV